MRKIANYILVALGIMFLGINMVFATEISADVKIKGTNKVGEKLEIHHENCNAPDGYECDVGGAEVFIKWFYNSSNSTTGGTEIESARNKIDYTIEESMVGKYIYVEVLLRAFNSSDEPLEDELTGEVVEVEYKDITDATANGSATVLAAGTTPDPDPDPEPDPSSYITYNLDESKFKISANATYNARSILTVTIDGVSKEDSNNYNVYFANGKNQKPPVAEGTNGCNTSFDTKYTNNGRFADLVVNSDNTVGIDVDGQWFMLNGYDYVYIIKKQYNSSTNKYTCEITKNPIKVAKPELPPLGSRYQYSFSSTGSYMSIYSLYPYTYSDTYEIIGTHKLITKVGLISDTDLLKKLANKESNALSELITYAKSASDESITFEQNDYDHKAIPKIDVQDGKYYYMYTYLNDANGYYRDLEDATVVMGKNGMLSNDVDWSSISNDEPIEDIWDYVIVYENGGGRDGVERMDNEKGTIGKPVVLAYNEYEWLKPKKRSFLGWKVYIEDANGNREAVYSSNGNVLTVGEGEVLDGGIKVPRGGRLVLVASWSPATGFVLPLILVLLLSIGSAVGITYIKKNKIFTRI